MNNRQEPAPPLLPSAGWYPDPELANTQRYWNGASWESHRAPLYPVGIATTAIAAGPPSSSSVNSARVFAILLPIVGFIIGLTMLNRQGNDGVTIMVLSVVAAVVWYSIFTSLAGG